MIQTRWRKVILDLWSNKARTILVVLAITVGVFAVGFVAGAQSILLRELDRGYQASDVASATLIAAPFDEAMVDSVARMPEVAVAEGRHTIRVNVLLEAGREQDLLLVVIPDFEQIQLDKVFPLSGEWPPREGAVLIERLAFPFIETAVGENIQIELDDGRVETLAVTGEVHNPNIPSAEIVNFAMGFITPETMESLGVGTSYTEMRYRVADNETDPAHIRGVNELIEEKLQKSGRSVFAINTPPPGEHWAQEIIETLVLLFTVFGFLILGLAGFLVVNTITALIAHQVQQIGIMKLVGGRRRQIMGMYFTMVLAYGLLSLLIGVPISMLMAQWVVQFAADLLNVRIISEAIPWSVIAMQIGVGLLVPLLAALWPVINGVQITTHQALNNQGIQSGSASQKLTDQVMTQLQRFLPVQRPLIISFRNTIRKKSRLLLTLLTLILGTALFIAVLSVRDSVQLTIDNFLRYDQYDVSVNFERPYRVAQLEAVAAQVPDVSAFEGWITAGVRRVYADDTTSEGIDLTAVPPDTTFMAPQLENGRWLQPGDQNAIVVNTDFIDEETDVQVGDEIILDVDGREIPWQVVGVVRGSASGMEAFVNYDYYSRAARHIGEATTLKVIIAPGAATTQDATANLLVDAYERTGIRVDGTRTTGSIRETIAMRFNIIIGFLVLMAVLLAIVGGLGLTTTMSINVLERIREIGVLRAIGASDSAVRQIVLAEGVFIGFLSWIVGSVLSLPASRILSQQVGIALMGFPLNFQFAIGGMFIWLLIIIFLAIAASLGPARNASQLTIREVLAYE